MLQAADYDYIRGLVRERSAIVLDETKDYLIETRLQRLAHSERYASVGDLVARARRDSAVSRRVVEAMTTNETSWMRDVHPYEGCATTSCPRWSAAAPAPAS
jgi:chemotaxis protein methyltransferase CheR